MLKNSLKSTLKTELEIVKFSRTTHGHTTHTPVWIYVKTSHNMPKTRLHAHACAEQVPPSHHARACEGTASSLHSKIATAATDCGWRAQARANNMPGRENEPCKCVHIRICIHRSMFDCMFLHVYICIHVHQYVYMYIRSYVYIYLHVYIHIHAFLGSTWRLAQCVRTNSGRTCRARAP